MQGFYSICPSLEVYNQLVRWCGGSVEKRETLLHVICKAQSIEIAGLRMLLADDRGEAANINVGNVSGQTPLHYVVLNLVCDVAITRNYNYRDVIKLLLDSGADINARNVFGQTPLSLTYCNSIRISSHSRAKYSNSQMKMNLIRILVNNGADVNVPNDQGEFMVHFLCKVDNLSPEETKDAMSYGTNLNVRDADGRTALHLACMRGRMDMVRLLLEAGAAVDLQDNVGNTALHYAAFGSHWLIVRLFLQYGVNAMVPNKCGVKPTDVVFMKDRFPFDLLFLTVRENPKRTAGMKQGRTY